MSKPLTKKQQYWLEHSRAADNSHLSFSAYAKKHQLNIQAFYNYRNILREKGLIPHLTVNPKPSAFIKVKPKFDQISNATHLSAPQSFIVRLPNHLQIEIPCHSNNITQLIEGLIKL